MRVNLKLVALVAMFMVVGLGAAKQTYQIEIRIIEASPEGGSIDPALKGYAKDLQALPYRSYRQLDSHTKQLRTGETVSMQFPGPERRLLKVRSNGPVSSKHSFTLTIDAMGFKSKVRIPDGGALIVAGPKHKNGVILLAVTARTTP